MNATVVTTAISILSFLWDERENVKKLILLVQDAYEGAAGEEKAKAVKEFIAKALGIEDRIEGAWPIAAPFFNRLVAKVKGK